jgi:hypothetical protein
MFTRLIKWAVGLILLVAAVGPARADAFAVGTVSLQIDFNLNVYFIMVDNFTGDPGYGGFASPPDYPVYTPLRLDNPDLTYTTLDSNGALVETTLNLDPIFPGPLDPGELLVFDLSTVFQSISFTASIFPDTFTVDSLRYQASNTSATASLANPDGSPLQPFQSADMVVNADPVSVPVEVPEPGMAVLMALTLCLDRIVVTRRRV